jgi:hypothetical protein
VRNSHIVRARIDSLFERSHRMRHPRRGIPLSQRAVYSDSIARRLMRAAISHQPQFFGKFIYQKKLVRKVEVVEQYFIHWCSCTYEYGDRCRLRATADNG